MNPEFPLIQVLTQKKAQNHNRFHVPGHKGKFPGCEFLSVAAPFDYTELPDTDSLYEADGIILALEKRVAALYKSAASFLSCGGATLCIQTMLAAVAGDGDTVILGRGCHGSAISALALLGISPIWVWPQSKAGLPGQVTSEEIESALKEHPLARAVYITSPNYFGQMADIQSIAKICSERNVPLLVDNAHGAHLPFVKSAIHPIEAGATFSADSAHKTLPALTGSAFLHSKFPVDKNEIKETMRLFGSTSPSYLMMASMDYAVGYLEINGVEEYGKLEGQVSSLKKRLEEKNYLFANGNMGPIRITISGAQRGYDGAELSEALRHQGIEPEMEAGEYVVLIPTPFNEKIDFIHLEQVLINLPRRSPITIKEALPLPKPTVKMTPRAAWFSTKEELSVENAVGRIAASNASPCPPGIPLVVPGEEIDPEMAQILKGYGIFKIKVVK